jgi:hypothetical protein
MSEKYELITVYRGKDSATYLSKDFVELGDSAKPIWVRQYPGDKKPFVKINLKDSDGFYQHNKMTKKEIENYKGAWDVMELQKLIAPTQSNSALNKLGDE